MKRLVIAALVVAAERRNHRKRQLALDRRNVEPWLRRLPAFRAVQGRQRELNELPPSQAWQAALLAVRITDRETFYWLVGRERKLPSLTPVAVHPASLPVRDSKLPTTVKAA
jgi:hypothetical protein